MERFKRACTLYTKILYRAPYVLKAELKVHVNFADFVSEYLEDFLTARTEQRFLSAGCVSPEELQKTLGVTIPHVVRKVRAPIP